MIKELIRVGELKRTYEEYRNRDALSGWFFSYINILAWQRYNKTKDFYLAESYENLSRFMKIYKSMFNNLINAIESKGFNINFHIKQIPINSY